MIEEKSLRQVSREQKIPETTLRGWKRKQDAGETILHGNKRHAGGGRKPKLPEEKEKEIVDWILLWRSRGVPIGRQMIATFVRQIDVEHPVKGSKGWIDNFMERWDLTLRTPTFQAAKNITIEGRNTKIYAFWKHILYVREHFEITNPTHIYNMDEVPVFF